MIPERSAALRFDFTEVLMIRRGPAQPAPPPKAAYSADEVRGGEITLNTPVLRGIFMAGPAGASSWLSYCLSGTDVSRPEHRALIAISV